MTVRKKGVMFLAVSVCMLVLGACSGKGVNAQSPEALIKSLITAYQEQNIQEVMECYGLTKDEKPQEDIQKEIDYNIRLFKAYEAKNIDFEKSDSLGKSGDSQLVYVWFNYEQEEKSQNCPVLSFYFVNKKDKRYVVVPAKDVTSEMSEYSRTAYEEFTETETYKRYKKDYDKFIKENPTYKEKLDKRFSQTVQGT